MAVLRFALLFGFFTLIAELIMKIAKSHRNWFSRPVLILNCVRADACPSCQFLDCYCCAAG